MMETQSNQATDGYRLSPQQRRCWALSREADGSLGQAFCEVDIEGTIDAAILAGALDDVVRRHEILRTTFPRPEELDEPIQSIHASEPVRLIERDWTHLRPDERPGRRRTMRDEAIAAPVALEESPSLDAVLVTWAADRRSLFLRLPRMCADAVGLANLTSEIARRYFARVDGLDDDRPEPMQYADAAELMSMLLESSDGTAGREFWRRQEASRSPRVRLPLERTASTPAIVAPSHVALRLEQEGAGALRVACAEHAITEEAFLLTCWSVLLGRVAAQPRIEVGVSFDGRAYDGLREALGPFSRVLPVVVALDPSTRLIDAGRRLCAALDESRGWQDYFGWGAPTSDDGASRGPAPSLSFAFERRAAPSFSGAGVRFSIAAQHVGSDRHRLKLVSWEGGDAEIEYDPRSFTREYIDHLAGQLSALLRCALLRPEAPLAEIDVVSEDERQRVLVDFSAEIRLYEGPHVLHHLFEEQARRDPGHPALVFESEIITYGELQLWSRRLAHSLVRAGVAAGTNVAVYLEPSPEMVTALLGVLMAGGAYVPLDPSAPHRRTAGLIEESGASVVVTQRGLASAIPAGPWTVVLVEDAWALPAEDSGDLRPRVGADDVAYVLFTSGSTGRPKGVVVNHRSICNRLFWGQEVTPLTPEDRVLQNTPYQFDFSVWEIFATLGFGATLILRRADRALDGSYLLRLMAEERVTSVHFTPSMLAAVLDEPGLAACRSLKRVFSGGEALPASTQRRFFERLTCELYNQYGPTEASVDVTCWRCRPGDDDPSVSIGHPMPNSPVYILDEAMRPVPIGVIGELYIGGTALARGYLGRPDLTAASFLPDTLSGAQGGRLYRTGDSALFREDGAILFAGRRDRQLKLRGIRVECGEIEAALRADPSVRDAVVVGVPSSSVGLGLVAYVVCRGAWTAEIEEDIRRTLASTLPESMRPSVILPLKELPLTAGGKVDHAALPDPKDAAASNGESAAPRTPIETTLVAIWKELLGVQTIGIHDNFFRLGGHSLQAMQMLARVRESLHVELTVRAIFESPTIERLAAAVESAPSGLGHELLPAIQRAPRERYRLGELDAERGSGVKR